LVGAILIVMLASAIIQGFALPGSQHYGIPADLYSVRDKFVVTAMDVPRALLMQNGMLDADGPLWSLNIEFHIYIAALFIALSVSAHGTLKRVAAAVLAVALVGWWVFKDSQFAFYLAVWSLGALLSIWGAEIERFKLVYAVLAWAGLAVHLVLLFSAPALLSAEEQNIWVALGLQFVACLSYAYAFFISDWGKQSPLWLKKTGDFSYSLYVIHFPLLLLLLSATQDFMGFSIWRSCAVAATATVAVITISIAFAAFFENQRHFKSHIRKVIDFLLMSKNRTSRT
jgi:peptidoglycan/LPS O-acetylase OafA/YrhL